MNPLSGVLDEAWRMYKTFAKHLLAIAFAIYLVAAVITALLGLAGRIGFFLGLIVLIVASFVLQATLVKAVQDVRDGRVDLSVGETVSAVTPSLPAVALASVLASLAIWIGFWFLIVPGLILITIWAVIVPVIVIERSSALASFERSRQLVRGRGWHVFATLVLVYVIMFIVAAVLSVIFSALPVALDNGLSSIIAGTLVSPFIAVVVTLVYYRLVGSATPAGGGDPYRGYGQPPGGYGQPPGGGFTEPPQGGGYGQSPAGGFTEPPQGGDPYGGGWNQPRSGGSEPPTQRLPQNPQEGTDEQPPP